MDQKAEFYELANILIKHRLVSPEDVRVISRPGTRKAGYYGRHKQDLLELGLERLDRLRELLNVPDD